MRIGETARTIWWLVHKDVLRELRTFGIWPGMLLLGLVTVFLLATQLNISLEQKTSLAGGLLWISVFFAGTVALERSFASERDAGCWQTLCLYPAPPSAVFLAKMAVNTISIVLLECVLIPAFVVLTDVPLYSHPLLMLLVVVLGTLCFASIGTLLSAITAGVRARGGLLALLLLPILTPVLLATAEATRLTLVDDVDPTLWQWVKLLAVFAGVFTTAGAVLFEFVMEE